MATLTVNTVDRGGFDLAGGFVATASGGDKFPNTGTEYAVFKNTSGGNITVTLAIQATVDSQVVTNRTVTVAATTGIKIVGPFPTSTYNDANSMVNFTYSTSPNLSVCICRNTTS